MNITPYFRAWWDLLHQGHWKLTANFNKDWHTVEKSESGLPHYRTKRSAAGRAGLASINNGVDFEIRFRTL